MEEGISMKVKALAVLFVLAALALNSCAAPSTGGTVVTPPATTMPVPSTTAPAAEPTAAGARAEDYFPALENYRLTYEGVGNEYASYVAYTEFQEGNKLQRRIDNGGTVTSRVYKWENGRLTRVNSVPEAYVRENLLNAPETESEVLLQEPLATGTAWDAANARRTITGVDVPVQTSLGAYTALEITTQGADYKTIDYYAKGIGLVKSVFQSGDAQVVSTLAEMKGDSPFLQVIRLYYPGVEGTGRYYREVQLALTTNMMTAAAVEEAYQVEPKGKAGRVFTPGTRILSIRKNTSNVLLVDLNQAFITERTGSRAYEEGVLHSAADTFGELYQTEKVLLTVEGKPYKSSQFSMKEGEILDVEKAQAQIIID
jgi:hypothetical protein